MIMAVLMRMMSLIMIALVMRVIMIASRVIALMFHRVRIPLMLECLHAPQPRKKNACPQGGNYYCGDAADHNGKHQPESGRRGTAEQYRKKVQGNGAQYRFAMPDEVQPLRHLARESDERLDVSRRVAIRTIRAMAATSKTAAAP
jgi:hypothetical protein